MTKETQNPLDVLRKMADEDLAINKSALDYESARTPQLHNKWLRMLYERKERLKSLEIQKKEIIKDRWLYYSGKASADVYKEEGPFQLKVLKGDQNLFIETDDKYKRIEIRIERAKSELEFVQKVLEEINRRSFVISNILKALAFMNGVN